MGAGFPGPLRSWLPPKRLSGHLINRPTGLTGGRAGTCAIRPGVGVCLQSRETRAVQEATLGDPPGAMSRRKQAKPQHLRSQEPQPERNEPGGVAPRTAGEPGE